MNLFFLYLQEWPRPVQVVSVSTAEEMALKLEMNDKVFMSFESAESKGNVFICRASGIQAMVFAGKK